MRKASLILFLALLAMSLCACGGTDSTPAAESPVPSAAATEAVQEDSPVLPDAGLHTQTPAPEGTEELEARKAEAASFIDRDAEDLIAALGEPLERNYAPSCLGDGEDGELVYEGFTVYTYRENDVEIVKDVD